MVTNMQQGHFMQKGSQANPMYRNMAQCQYNASASSFMNSNF
jgi:hypothetical protein